MELSPVVLSYASLKERVKGTIDNLSYCDIFLNFSAYMFEYATNSDIRTQFIELYLNVYGACAVADASIFPPSMGNPNEKLVVCMAVRAGTPNANGQGRDLILTTFDGRCVTVRDFETNGDKVVYIKNNLYATPDFTIGESGNTVKEIIESLRHNIVNSRLTPIVVVKDAKTKAAVEKTLEENRAGTYAVVVSDNIMTEGEETVLNVTNVNDQDKIQYINHAYDDELRHFFNLHGLDITGASKQAQQTVEEVSSGSNSRKVLPYGRLAERTKACEEIRSKFGVDISVRFSLPWRIEFGLEETPVEKAEEAKPADEDKKPEAANEDEEGGENNA